MAHGIKNEIYRQRAYSFQAKESILTKAGLKEQQLHEGRVASAIMNHALMHSGNKEAECKKGQ